MKWALIWIAATLNNPTVTYIANSKPTCEAVGGAVAARHTSLVRTKPVFLCARLSVDIEVEPVLEWAPPVVGTELRDYAE